MASYYDRTEYLRGVRGGLPFVLVVVPFALLFGVVATEAGLPLLQVLSFSVVVIAGAAQFTALQLMAENVPTLVIIISALTVNLRMAMYSASLTPHLGALPFMRRAFVAYCLVDQSYALSILEYEKRPEMSLAQKFSYFMGAITPVVPLWYAATVAGAMVGQAIPPALALDFAVPITFLAMIGPMLRTQAHVLAAAVSVSMALIFAFLPWNLGLIVAAIAGMVTGAEVERRVEMARAAQ
ncbi:AzlC family ABC transporter permease [Shimia marina]|uniref:Inner membrane protein YgaZ n=1 Tax=Shimia marina TaxID=321267 RepID=A0A0P1EUM8_9RHOB|nr:AzlC family ABC transporter permease [Shimia marina]CUH54246.1 Inner membrane protein YgaZ [Shimia marina]SFD98486.1 Predicted branched-chain amino acid permease (azaleucine resistance) [Shimia marina]